MTERNTNVQLYLNVPVPQNHVVEDLGGRWDMSAKKWYVPQGVDLSKFIKWFEKDLRALLCQYPDVKRVLRQPAGRRSSANRGIQTRRQVKRRASTKGTNMVTKTR